MTKHSVTAYGGDNIHVTVWSDDIWAEVMRVSFDLTPPGAELLVERLQAALADAERMRGEDDPYVQHEGSYTMGSDA